VNALLADVVERELAKALQAQREMFASRAVLQALCLSEEHAPAFPTELQRTRAASERRKAMGPLRDQVWKYLNAEISLDVAGVREKFFEIDASWRRYRIALREDADAASPEE
jgi:hypothetical protein